MIIKSLELRSIPYEIKDTKSLKISISVKNNGTIIIKKNKLFSNEKVIEFVDNHIDWIEKAYLKNYIPPRKYITGEEYLLLGKTYHLNLVYDNLDTIEVDFDHLIIIIHTSSTVIKHIDKLMNSYLSKLSNEVFTILFEKALNNIQTYLEIRPKFFIKQYKSRWGCCIPKENKIILNKSLIHVDLDLILYVIYHELCHFKYLNHSPLFHQFLSLFVPNEKEMKKRLNKFSPEYR